jgi:hypothetical protein
VSKFFNIFIGEYVSSGGFIIRGKKNFCTNNQLVMGFGLMFKVADESIINHIDVC